MYITQEVLMIPWIHFVTAVCDTGRSIGAIESLEENDDVPSIDALGLRKL